MTDNNQQLVPRTPLNAGATVMPIVPSTIDEVWRIAQLVVASGMAPKEITKPEQASVIIMHGAEVGLSPMVALQSIAVINGKPALYGDGLLAVVRKSGMLERIVETLQEAGTDGAFARCTVIRAGQRVTREFSKKDAIVAGLWGKRGRSGEPTTWVTYPNRMLQMRARAFALRDVFPDVLKGLASREEMEDVGNGVGAVVVPPEPPPSAPIASPIEEAVEKARKGRKRPGKADIELPAKMIKEDAIEETIAAAADRLVKRTGEPGGTNKPAPAEEIVPPPPPPDPGELIAEGDGADPSDIRDIEIWGDDGIRPARAGDLL